MTGGRFRIGVDGRAFASPAGGVRRYVWELYGALARVAPDVEVVAIGATAGEALPAAVTPHPATPFPTNLGWMAASIPLAVRSARLDVFHAPAYTAPLWGVHPQAVTIHDVSPVRVPEWDAYRNDPLRRLFYKRSALAADRVITDSQFSRGEITAAYGIPADRIDVVPLAAAETFTPGAFDPAEAPAGVTPPYALHVGDLQIRRNLATALAAIIALRADPNTRSFRLQAEGDADPSSPRSFRLQAEGDPDPSHARSFRLQAEGDPDPSHARSFRLQAEGQHLSLVCAGVDRGIGADLQAQARAAGDAGALVLTGPVSEKALVNLYRGAAMLVYPSRYEGFGLPVLEAMRCGLPVVAANCASVPELVADAGLLLEPLAVAAWQDAIGRVLSDPAMAARLRDAGLARAAQFSWTRTATDTLAVLRACAARAHKGRP